ncbi:MBL fold metallo-hydrolase [Bythopirellula goksoeyrii]|uniref:Beta-lactamase hydrolase-like protein n=1 Tax=Bythopirellula goksoeyrii TaxID=1400387 RepID=A0A5B9Q474_9BACT|nr:MBL fold metallo-hydrolase [Bythopirellula goksoeyrii]QEG33828.1 Beta-lactamase hydrolase-like protein [Bythopirellula goksoeyrii]
MFFHQRFVPGLAIYSYIVGDEKTKEAAVIDPTRDVNDFLEIASREGLHIRHVLETHVHADFVSGSRELKARLGDGVTIHASGLGGKEWTPPYADHVVKNSEEISLGSIRLKAIHTPGHTLEHLSWALFDESRSSDTPWLIFTGDFVFVGDVGRPDLLGEEARKELAHQLYRSVFETLPILPGFTEIFPGHGAGSLCGKAIGSRSSSTLGYERRFNAALVEKPEKEWIADLMDQMPLSPPYFARMKRVNKEGPPVIGPELPGQRRWSAKEVHERMCENCLIVDVRSKESFAAAHIPDAINIPFGPTLPTWAGWVLPYDRPTLIVLDRPEQMHEVTTHLLRVGFDDIQGYLEGGMDAWEVSGYPLEKSSTLSVHSLNKQLGEVTVLDVRTEKEWNGGHIEGAIHIHGGKLQENFSLVPHEKPVVVICGSGYRASIAASFLKREGYKDVANVLGGMTAWNAAGFSVEKSDGSDNSGCRTSETATTCS